MSEAKLGEALSRALRDPLDGDALRALAKALVDGGDRKSARAALGLAARAFGRGGQLPMALACARELEGDDPRAARPIVDELAAAYGRGSTRVDPAHRRRPPAPPTAATATSTTAGAAAQRADASSVKAALDVVSGRLTEASAEPLPAVPLFHSLAAGPFRRLVSTLRVREHRAGDVVLDVGSPGDACYVVAHGTVEISRPGPGGDTLVLGHLRSGAFFGEMALLTDSPRTARARCEDETVLLEIPRRGLDELAASEPDLSAVIAAHARDRLLANLMLTSELFARLEPASRERLVRAFTTRVVEAGGTLIEEGQPAGTLLVILSGELVVEKRDSDGSVLRVATLTPGEVVGEISLLTRRAATATVRAARKTVVLALARDDFNEIVASFPEVLTHLYQLAVTRERDLERLLAEQVVEAEDYLI